MDASLCDLCAQKPWGRAGTEVGRVTPSRECWQLSLWWEGVGEARTRAQCEQRLLTDYPNPPGLGRSQGAGAEAMKVSLNLVPPLVSVHPPPSLTLAPLPQRGTELEEGVLEQPLAWMSVHVVQPWHRAPDPASLAPLWWLPCPIHTCMCSCVWSFVKVLKLGTLNNFFNKQGKSS